MLNGESRFILLRSLIPFGIAALLEISVIACSNSNGASASNSKPVPVHVYTVAEETALRRVQAVGSLFALEESTLSAEVDGVVSKVMVDVGDPVVAGQPMVLLDQRELQFDLERQLGAVREVRAQLGIGPKEPPPPDSRKLASVQHAQADLFDAERKYTRAKELFRDSLISQQQLDEAASRYQSTRATYEIALQEVDRLKAVLISTEASERLAEKKLSDATVRAPFQGTIRSRNVHPGEYLRAQTPVMVLVRTDSLRARLAVPERWAGWIKQDAIVNFQVEAFPGETFHGRISRINPAVSQDSRTFETEALLDNKNGRLKPGFFVQASVPSEKREKTIFVPEDAVNYRYGVYKVFMLNGDRVAEREIRPAGQTDDEKGRRFEIAEGLKPGDRVAAAVSGELRDGDKVQESEPSSPTPDKTAHP
jgi:RND family efflux transporter MFP subunit